MIILGPGVMPQTRQKPRNSFGPSFQRFTLTLSSSKSFEIKRLANCVVFAIVRTKGAGGGSYDRALITKSSAKKKSAFNGSLFTHAFR
jgi:hypothetical protein